MSSHSRSVGADAGGRQSMISGNATGFNNEPFQQSYPVYRESNTTNVSLLFPQENEYRTGYPSPVGTPLEFHYTPGTQAAVDYFYTPAALPAQVVADHRFSVPQPERAFATGYPQTATVDGRPSVGPVDWDSLGGYPGAPLQSAEQTQGFARPSVAPAPYYPQTVTVDGRPSVGPVDWDSLGGYAGAALHPVGQRQGLAKPSIAPALHYPQTTTVDGRPSVGSVDWASPGGYTGAPLQSTDQTYGLAGPSVAPAQPFPQTATAGGRLATNTVESSLDIAWKDYERGVYSDYSGSPEFTAFSGYGARPEYMPPEYMPYEEQEYQPHQVPEQRGPTASGFPREGRPGSSRRRHNSAPPSPNRDNDELIPGTVDSTRSFLPGVGHTPHGPSGPGTDAHAQPMYGGPVETMPGNAFARQAAQFAPPVPIVAPQGNSAERFEIGTPPQPPVPIVVPQGNFVEGFEIGMPPHPAVDVTRVPTYPRGAMPSPGDVPLELPALAGTNRLEIYDHSGFERGQQVCINPGGTTEEIHFIVAFGSIIVSSPLTYHHRAGEIVRPIRWVPRDYVPVGPWTPWHNQGGRAETQPRRSPVDAHTLSGRETRPPAPASEHASDSGAAQRRDRMRDPMADALQLIKAVRGGDMNDRGGTFRIDARADVPLFVERLGFTVWVASVKSAWGLPVTWQETSERQCAEFLRVFPSKLKKEEHTVAWLAIAQEEAYRSLLKEERWRDACQYALAKLSASFDFSLAPSEAMTALLRVSQGSLGAKEYMSEFNRKLTIVQTRRGGAPVSDREKVDIFNAGANGQLKQKLVELGMTELRRLGRPAGSDPVSVLSWDLCSQAVEVCAATAGATHL